MSFFNRHHFFSPSGHSAETVEEFFGLRARDGLCPQKPWNPPLDVIESADGIMVRVEVPGICASDVQMRLVGSTLQISGIRRECCKRQKKSYQQMEIHYGPFERTVELPGKVDPAAATARYENGMVEAFFPRSDKTYREMLVIEVTM